MQSRLKIGTTSHWHGFTIYTELRAYVSTFADPSSQDASTFGPHAIGFGNYVMKRKLKDLVTYLLLYILDRVRFRELDKILELDKPEYGACRNVLRAGPAGSLRVNIRAVAQYASESDNDSSATDNVDQCLRALEELDSLLLNASRNDPQASVKSTMKSKIGIAIDALDKLLKTVPSEVLDKGQAIADAYLNNEEEGGDLAPQNLDPELKQLESVL
ncbi:hypothetical protein LguiA_017880 [Lonicera macranthoides]